MTPYAAMEPERMTFLYELYKRSAGDPRQGVPYEELVDALGFGERVTKCLQRELQQAGLVELTAVPGMTTVGWTVIDREHRWSHRQTIGMTSHGVRFMEDLLAKRAPTEPLIRSTASSL
jgi:hypothetical protein